MKSLSMLKPKEKFFHNDFFVWDTETTGFRLDNTCVLIFGVVYGWNYKKVIYSKEDFIKEFEHERYKKKKVFAHNAEFDLNVLYDNIYNFDKSAISFLSWCNLVAEWSTSKVTTTQSTI